MAWSQTAEGGSYNAVEAKDKWDEMFADPLHQRDKNGKNGADRLLVHMFDDVVGSSGTKSSSRGYTLSGKTQKNKGPEQLEGLDALIASGHDGFNAAVFDAAGGAGLQLSLKKGNGSNLQKGGVHSQASALAIQDKPVANNPDEAEDGADKKKRRRVLFPGPHLLSFI